MPAKRTLPDGFDLVERYQSVLSVKQIALQLGVSHGVIVRFLEERGVRILTKSESSLVLNMRKSSATEAEIVAMFADGIGIRGIQDRTGISIATVDAILKKNSIAARNRSEQQFARMSRTSFEDRQKLAESANVAKRGRARTIEQNIKMAKTYEARQNRRGSIYEDALVAYFRSAGFELSTQKAIGPYNCDFTIGSIAVEVFGGQWHWHGEHLARSEERFRYILNSGYDVLIVPFSRTFPYCESTASYLVGVVNEMRSNPPAVRQYRVIWGAGDFITGGDLNDDKICIDPPFTNARDSTTGRYSRVSR